MGGMSERMRELRRRRQRRQKLDKLKLRAAKASASEKQVIAEKIRNMTPGAEVIITNWNLIKR